MSSSDEEPEVPEAVNEAFLQAAAHFDVEGLESGLKAGVKTFIRDAEGLTALMLTARAGKVECVELLLAHGANPNLRSYVVKRRRPRGWEVVGQGGWIVEQVGCKFAALHFAVYSGSAGTVDALLKAPDIKVNAQADGHPIGTGNSLTPLHIAAGMGFEAIVSSLLAVPGIDVNLATDMGDTALNLARSPASRIDTYDCMFQNEAVDPGPPYPAIMATIKKAGGRSYQDIHDEKSQPSVEFIESCKQRMAASGQSPTEFFYEADGMEAKLAAIKLGADVHAPGPPPPIFRAMYFTVRTLARALVAAGADVNAVWADRGCTPLHLAVEQGNRETVEFLVSNGAKVNAKDKEGRTPLDLNKGSQAMALVLKNAGGISAKDA
eukprot:TRINITY_DN64854_c0_g1_i1.p1 TRINITY_DN64854_c0_g1~~TRINITY_DN64854_c0_g1_i1.p1  ORF type:complete len:379 (+),score=65.61 TRINITY_DN64854_c0_g1_i1:91-1227(+)